MTHDLERSRLRSIRKAMVGRCHNPRDRFYHRYGARGISVCPRWRAGIANFIADMGPRPPGHQIDRIDNDGNYEPGNCRWATPTQNARNSTSVTLVEWRGERKSLSEWSDMVGISASNLSHRIRSGWPIDAALTTPLCTGRLGMRGDGMTLRKDLSGQRFGKWTVVGGWQAFGQKIKWDCLCDCGTRRFVNGTTLRCGRSRCCGKCEIFGRPAVLNGQAADAIANALGAL